MSNKSSVKRQRRIAELTGKTLVWPPVLTLAYGLPQVNCWRAWTEMTLPIMKEFNVR